jgi:hypothetical protein
MYIPTIDYILYSRQMSTPGNSQTCHYEREKPGDGMAPEGAKPGGYILNFCIIFISRGGRTSDRGKDTRNPTPQPASQGLRNALVNPVLMRVIAKDMHMAIMVDIQKPKNRI